MSAVLAGLSSLTRYGAIVYTATACLMILFFFREPIGKRFGKSVLYGIEAMIPVAIWVYLDILLTQTVSSRRVHALAGIGTRVGSYFFDLHSVLLFWILPDSWIQTPFYPAWINQIILVLFLGLMAAGSWFLLKNTKSRPALFRMSTALLLFSVLYVMMTLIISLLTYPPITIGTRMFSPMFLMVFWLLALIVSQAGQKFARKKWISTGILVIMLLFVGWSGWRGLRIVDDNRLTGLGFQSTQWQTSELIHYVEHTSPEQVFVSNEEMALLYLADRRVYPLAEIYLDEPLQTLTTYGEGLQDTEGEINFRKHGAYLILFNSIYEQFEGLYGSRTEERVLKLIDGLQLVYHGNDGDIYRFSETVEE
jgi:hypothetical protein